MQAFFHLLFLSCYGGLAVAAAVYGPRWLPWLDQSPAVGLGIAILLGGGLLHEVYARTGRKTALGKQLLSMPYEYSTLQEELGWLRHEVEALRQALGAASQSGQVGASGKTTGEVMAEVKVLKSLVPRLSPKGAGDPDPGDPGPGDPGPGDPGPGDPGPGRGPHLVPEPGPGRPVAERRAPGSTAPVAEDPNPAAMLNIVREALRDDRIDLVLQPIVSLPQRKRRFYECFSRLRTDDGTVILPEQYIALAERESLITVIDNMLLFRCVQLIRKIHHKNQSVGFFCNISPHSLADEDFFGDFVDFLESNEELAPHLIFEFAQGAFARWSEVGARLLDRLAYFGCRFSIDQVTDLDLDAAELAGRHVRFVKIEASRLLGEMAEGIGLLRALRRHNIDLIVEKIEAESRLIELLDYDVDFGQGFLFGAPRLARPDA